MKKLLLALMLSFILIVPAYATDNQISISKIAATVPASGVVYSPVVDLSGKLGYFSVQLVTTGTGVLTVSYQLSNSEKAPYTWSTPVGASTIAAGLSANTYLYKFEPYTIGKWLRLSFTETGTSNAVVIDSKLASQ